jgi:pilus assembly protein Flp/PilA
MKNFIAKLSVAIKSLAREDGQDLVEYALVVALIAFAATASMKVLASDINVAFSNIASALTTNIT